MLSTITILKAVGSAEPKNFYDFYGSLSDRPAREEKHGWKQMLQSVDALESMELIKTNRDGKNEIQSLSLTPLGQERLREALEEDQRHADRLQRRRESTAAVVKTLRSSRRRRYSR